MGDFHHNWVQRELIVKNEDMILTRQGASLEGMNEDLILTRQGATLEEVLLFIVYFENLQWERIQPIRLRHN